MQSFVRSLEDLSSRYKGLIAVRALIRFSADKRGRRLAHYWSARAHRLVRLPFADAPALVASGLCEEAGSRE